MSLTHPVHDSGIAAVPKPRPSQSHALRRIVRVVADGTGRSPEEVWLLAAAATAVTVSVVAVRGIIWVVDLANRFDMRRVPTGRASG